MDEFYPEGRTLATTLLDSHRVAISWKDSNRLQWIDLNTSQVIREALVQDPLSSPRLLEENLGEGNVNPSPEVVFHFDGELSHPLAEKRPNALDFDQGNWAKTQRVAIARNGRWIALVSTVQSKTRKGEEYYGILRIWSTSRLSQPVFRSKIGYLSWPEKGPRRIRKLYATSVPAVEFSRDSQTLYLGADQSYWGGEFQAYSLSALLRNPHQVPTPEFYVYLGDTITRFETIQYPARELIKVRGLLTDSSFVRTKKGGYHELLAELTNRNR